MLLMKEIIHKFTTTGNTTSLIYCPSQFGNYRVSIAGNNTAGEGDVSSQVVVLLGIYAITMTEMCYHKFII